jgi:dienelactone hydrolase
MMVTEKTRAQIEELTKDMNFKIKMYPGTKHGFCLKSNEDDENERNIAAEATKDAAEFFRASL